MKSLKRRLLSLFMAMVMVLSLAPGALAEDVQHSDQHTEFVYTPVSDSTTKQHKKTCKTENCTFTEVTENCISDNSATSKGESGHAAKCTLCKQELDTVAHTLNYSNKDGDTHDASCSASGCGYSVTNQQHSYTGANNTCACGKAKPADTLTKITLSPTSSTLNVGNTLQLTATPVPAGASLTGLTWLSSNNAVATVNNGMVTAVAAGTTTITAKVGNISATCSVTVNGEYSIAIKNKNVSITQEGQHTIDATLKRGDTTVSSVNFNYKSNNEKVATVSESGVIRGVAPGTATITVSCIPATGLQAVTATVNVTVSSRFEIGCSSTKFTSMGQSITLTPKFDGEEVFIQRVAVTSG